MELQATPPEVTARAFLTVKQNLPEAEIVRLQGLHSQIPLQSTRGKERLVAEFLSILNNQNERVWPRIQACNVLGGRCRELGCFGSRSVARAIRKIIRREFVAGPAYPLLPRRLALREKATLEFCLLQALLAAGVRIHPDSMAPFSRRVLAAVRDPERRQTLAELLSNIDSEKR